MQKHKKGMQDQTATQNLGDNELSDDQLLEASGGQATVTPVEDQWGRGYYINVDGEYSFGAGVDEGEANRVANAITEAQKNGKYIDYTK